MPLFHFSLFHVCVFSMPVSFLCVFLLNFLVVVLRINIANIHFCSICLHYSCLLLLIVSLASFHPGFLLSINLSYCASWLSSVFLTFSVCSCSFEDVRSLWSIFCDPLYLCFTPYFHLSFYMFVSLFFCLYFVCVVIFILLHLQVSCSYYSCLLFSVILNLFRASIVLKYVDVSNIFHFRRRFCALFSLSFSWCHLSFILCCVS